MKPSTLAIVLGAALIGLAIVIVAGVGTTERHGTVDASGGKRELAANGTKNEPGNRRADLAIVESPSEERSVESADLSLTALESGSDVPHVEPAVVVWRFVDADTGEELSDVQLRGSTDARFIDREVSSGDETALSPGSWTFSARLSPYEDESIPPFVVQAGGRHDVDTVELRRGWGSIASMVDVPASVAEKGPFEVRLHGEGRSECHQPESTGDRACPHCGYRDLATYRTVAAMEPFQFERLAAGEYRALVFDSDRRVLFNERIPLETGEAVRVDLRMEFVDLEFDVTGPDGQPFTGVWEEEGTKYEGPVEFYFRADDVACASARTTARGTRMLRLLENGEVSVEERTDRVFLRDPDVIASERRARQTVERVLADSPRSRSLTLTPEMIAELMAATQAARGEGGAPPEIPRREPDDRPRAEDDAPAFAPRAASPTFKTRPLDAKRTAAGRYRVLQVPAQADGALVTSGPFFARVAVDVRRWAGVPVEITFDSRCSLPSKTFVGSQSCFDCHGEAGVAEMAR